MKRLFTIVFGASVAVTLASGCEAIVGGDLPAFSCEPGAPNACSPGQVCSPAGVCVARCPDTPCENGTACNVDAHVCVPLGQLPEAGPGDSTIPDAPGSDRINPSDVVATDTTASDNDSPTNVGEIGAPCRTQAECLPNLLCADSSILTPPVTQTTGAVCTKPCCKSEDCPPDFACFGPGTGGNYCVRASQLQRGTAKGAKTGGSTCASGDECRSGVCQGTPMRCADACCTGAAACPGGGVCRLSTVEGHLVMACAEPPPGSTGNDTLCGGANDCRSGICYGSNPSCRPRCCGAATCAAESPAYGACAYFSQNGAVKEYVSGCLYPNTSPPGGGKVGDPCDPAQQDILCSTAFCDPMGKYCTDVCCTDADCAGYPGYTVCRPSLNPRYLVCQKP